MGGFTQQEVRLSLHFTILLDVEFLLSLLDLAVTLNLLRLLLLLFG
jgi:hypothetical protein